MTLESHEIDALKIESKRILDMQQFIDVSEIDPRYFQKPYDMVPADEEAAEGYLVIREALRDMNKLGVGQITMRGREHIVTIGAVDKGLVMEVLRYAVEIKSPKPYSAVMPQGKVVDLLAALKNSLKTAESKPDPKKKDGRSGRRTQHAA